MSATDTVRLIAATLNTITSSNGQLIRLRAGIDTDGRIVVDATTFDFGIDRDVTERVMLFPSPATPIATPGGTANGGGVTDQSNGDTEL